MSLENDKTLATMVAREIDRHARLSVLRFAAGLVCATALITAQPFLNNLAVLGAIVGMPVFATVWLGWMLREMKSQSRTGD